MKKCFFILLASFVFFNSAAIANYAVYRTEDGMVVADSKNDPTGQYDASTYSHVDIQGTMDDVLSNWNNGNTVIDNGVPRASTTQEKAGFVEVTDRIERDAERARAINFLTDKQGAFKLQRAVARVTLQSVSQARSQIESVKDCIISSSNLSDIKSCVSALSTLQNRDWNDLKAAVIQIVNSGAADE